MALDKNAIIKEAQKLTAKGQYDKAIAEWKKLVRESPNDANIFNTIGDLSLKKNAKAEAVDAYKKAADILAGDGFTSKAIALYKKVLNIDPKKVEVHIALGDLNAEKGLTGNALESYKLAADHHVQKGDMVRALGIYQKMADLNPSNAAFRVKLADMYAKEGIKGEAVKAYLEAADALISAEAFQEARQLFEKVLALDTHNKVVYHKAGIVYFKEGKFAEACKAFKPAFEADSANQELADLYLDALAKTGKQDEAEETIKKILSHNSERIDLREKILRFALANKDYTKALAEADGIVKIRVDNREYDAAEELLKGIAAESPKHAGARQALADFYAAIRREEDAARELVKAAELLSGSGDREGARECLNRATELVPGMAEALRLLETLDAQPAAEEARPEPVAASIEVPSAFNVPPPMVEETTVAGVPAAASPAESEEDPAVDEAFTEVDVLVKYGLASKAVEQLETLAGKFPASRRVRIRLRDLYREQDNAQKVVEHSLGLADLYSQAGMTDQAEAVLREALELAPGNRALLARLGSAPEGRAAVSAPREEAGTPEPLFSGPMQDFAFDQPAPQEAVRETAPEAAPLEDIAGLQFTPPEVESAAPASLQSEQTLEETLKEDWIPPAPEISPERFRIPEPVAEQGQALEETLEESLKEDWIPPAPEATPEPVREPEPARAPEIDLSEIWAEAEFYYQQGLFEEAKQHYEKILGYAPTNRRARERIAEMARQADEVKEFSKLAEAVEGLEGLVPAGAPAEGISQSVSDEEAVKTLMQEISMLKQQEEAPSAEKIAPPSKPSRAPSRPMPPEPQEAVRATHAPVRQPGAEEFFDLGSELGGSGFVPQPPAQEGRAGEFFDLAAELREELSGISLEQKPSASGEEQSLDDLFAEFKKGIEVQGGKEESDTHYNLGIAYKEMGLLDDAVAEFLLTHEGEPKFVQSRYMLGLCYMEKGEYHKAIAEIGNSINFSQIFSVDAGETLGMHYDLALAYQGAGNRDAAIREFQRVADIDPSYRDVEAKIRELQQGDFISLDQLKEDIEREISSKFLEEGERIEREEKTKKTEKVKSF